MPQDNEWHHVAISYNGKEQRNRYRPIGNFYVDCEGKPDDAVTTGPYNWLSDPSSPILIGTGFESDYGQEFFHGAIDDVRIYNRALTEDDVCNLYEASNQKGLLYVVNKDGCNYAGGEQQTVTFPFSVTKNQEETSYYRAVVRSWHRGAR